VVNVASGTATSIRSIIDQLCELAGVPARVKVDGSLVRALDPADIRADASLLTEITGWRPEIPLSTTLADVLAEAANAR
jgi:GDP-4-dehydro-6-deoxy-D-mannose reductase